MTEQLTHVERTFFASSIRGTKVLRLLAAHAARESALVLEVEERRKVDLENCKRIDALVAQLEAAERSHREALNIEAAEVSRWKDLAHDANAARVALDGRVRELVAQLAELTGERNRAWLQASQAQQSNSELTRERDEAREGDGYWHAAAVVEGKAKLRAEGELRAQERATQQLSTEVTRLTEALAAAERDAKQAWREQDEALNERNEARQCQEAAEARVRELEAHLVASDGARSRAEARVEALETLLAASKARAAQWQADAELYRIDADVAQDHLAAAKSRSVKALNIHENTPAALVADLMAEALRG